jgi:hypothetical protein
MVFVKFLTINLFRNYALGKAINKPSPLAGEGRVRGVVSHRNHPHPGPLPSRERGKNPENANWFKMLWQMHSSDLFL